MPDSTFDQHTDKTPLSSEAVVDPNILQMIVADYEASIVATVAESKARIDVIIAKAKSLEIEEPARQFYTPEPNLVASSSSLSAGLQTVQTEIDIPSASPVTAITPSAESPTTTISHKASITDTAARFDAKMKGLTPAIKTATVEQSHPYHTLDSKLIDNKLAAMDAKNSSPSPLQTLYLQLTARAGLWKTKTDLRPEPTEALLSKDCYKLG